MGVVLFEMVTGKNPFPGNFTPDALDAIHKGKYILPRKVNPTVSSTVQKIIKKAMHHKVKKRYKDLQILMSVLSKYLKKYKGQKQINESIKQYIYDGKTGKSNRTKENKESKESVNFSSKFSLNLYKIFLIVLVLSTIIVGVSFFIYQKGLYYEYFMSKDMSAMMIDIKINGNYKNYKDKNISCSLYEKSKKYYKKIENVEFNFSADLSRKKKRYYYISSNKVYLKASNYRIRVNVGTELYQKDFYLEPFIMQKKAKRLASGRIVKFNHKEISHLPLKIKYTTNDISTRRDLTEATELFVYYYKKWFKWDDYIKLKNIDDILVTGKKYILKFVCEGYYNKFLNIYIKPDRVMFTIDSEMIPIPGVMLIKSNHEGLKVLFNNSSHYISGGKTNVYKEIPPVKLKFQKFILSPDKYYITAVKSGTLSKTVPVNIAAKKYTKIFIKYNKKDESIDFKIY